MLQTSKCHKRLQNLWKGKRIMADIFFVCCVYLFTKATFLTKGELKLLLCGLKFLVKLIINTVII